MERHKICVAGQSPNQDSNQVTFRIQGKCFTFKPAQMIVTAENSATSSKKMQSVISRHFICISEPPTAI